MTKAKAWMPIYIGDYLGDTQRLSTEQHGAYLLLIFDYWRNGPPPDDDEVLQQITMLDGQRWLKHKPMIQRFFEIEDGVWVHRRIERERVRAMENSASNSAKAKAAASARWNAPSNAPSNAEGLPDAMLGTCPPPSPSPSPSELPKPSKDKPFERGGPNERQIVFDEWNAMASKTKGSVKSAKLISDPRAKSLKARLHEHSLDEIVTAIHSIPESRFLTGDNDRGWTANFDWLLQPNSMMKLIEGAYHGNGRGKPSGWLA
jgi:uncharacterized protein YdaU (DUF1376 family)